MKAMYYPAGFTPDYSGKTQPEGNYLRLDANGRLYTVTETGAGTNNAYLSTIATNTSALVTAAQDVTPAATTDDVGRVSDNGVNLTVKQAAISVGVSTAIVAAVPGKSIVVLSYTVVVDAAVTVGFRSNNGAGTVLAGQMSLAANGGVSAGYNPKGHFWTVAGEALFLVTGASIGVRGHLTYVER